jgi:hypothetical protein
MKINIKAVCKQLKALRSPECALDAHILLHLPVPALRLIK